MDSISSWLSSTLPKRTKIPFVTALFHTFASASDRKRILSRYGFISRSRRLPDTKSTCSIKSSSGLTAEIYFRSTIFPPHQPYAVPFMYWIDSAMSPYTLHSCVLFVRSLRVGRVCFGMLIGYPEAVTIFSVLFPMLQAERLILIIGIRKFPERYCPYFVFVSRFSIP